MNTRTTGDGFLTVSFLLQKFPKLPKTALNTELLHKLGVRLGKHGKR
jgi:hypothetical protein